MQITTCVSLVSCVSMQITTVVDNNSGRKRRDVSTISSQPLEVDLEGIVTVLLCYNN